MRINNRNVVIPTESRLKQIVDESVEKVLSETSRRQKAQQEIAKRTKAEELNERSINAKKRDVNNAINVFTKQRSGYNGIKSFGIVSAENADSIEQPRNVNKKQMKSLSDSLKSAHYGFVKQKGHFAGNDEYSYFVFNIRLETLMYYAGQYEQTSFFFGRLIDTDNGKQVESSYYEKSDKTAPYDKKTNPYVLIERTTEWLDQSDSSDYSELGGRFKYIIPLKCFEEVNAQIEQNKKLFEEKDRETIIDFTMNRVGQTPWNYRGKLYKGLF